jgi:rhodanese-related sulfurtransferase
VPSAIEFVKSNILLIAIAVLSGAMLLWPLVRRSAGGPWVNTVQLTQLINRENATVIDVRDVAEYAKGHIVGARNVPLAQFEKRVGELEKLRSKPLVVHCESGNRSAKALDILRKNGFEKLYNLSGGYAAWLNAGLPAEK